MDTKLRKVAGALIPLLTDEQVKLLYDIDVEEMMKDPKTSSNRWILPLLAENVTHMFVEIKGVRFYHSVYNECAKAHGYMSWKHMLESKPYAIPGQVKNFLVACRTSTLRSKEMKVLVRGSKSSAASGIWIRYYAFLLARSATKLLIDLYDTGEIPGEESFVVPWGANSCEVTIRRFSSYYLGTAAGYTIAIDDAYVPAEGIVPWKPESESYSLKLHGVLPDYAKESKPFLHHTEVRYFSNPPSELSGMCTCVICTAVAQSATSYEEYQYIRSIVSLLGTPGCGNVDYYPEVKRKAELLAEIVRNPSLIAEKKMDLRLINAISDEFNVTQLQEREFKVSPGLPSSLEVTRFSHASSEPEAIKRLEGERIMFIGVSAEILGSTKIKVNKNTTKVSQDPIVFASSSKSAFGQLAANFMWVPEERVNGYVRTGYEWKGYYEHRRMRTEIPVAQVQLKSQLVGKSVRGVLRGGVVKGISNCDDYGVVPLHKFGPPDKDFDFVGKVLPDDFVKIEIKDFIYSEVRVHSKDDCGYTVKDGKAKYFCNHLHRMGSDRSEALSQILFLRGPNRLRYPVQYRSGSYVIPSIPGVACDIAKRAVRITPLPLRQVRSNSDIT